MSYLVGRVGFLEQPSPVKLKVKDWKTKLSKIFWKQEKPNFLKVSGSKKNQIF